MKTEAQFQKMDISALEGLVEEGIYKSREGQKESIEVLIYLQTSGRFKENKRYVRSSFYNYIDDRFNIRKGTYEESKLSFVKFPEETIEYGVGLVSKVFRVCGRAKAKTVLAKFDTAKAAHKNEVKRETLERIIQSNRSNPLVPKGVIDWRGKYETEYAAHEATKMRLQTALNTIKELRAQVDKLTITIQKERGEPIIPKAPETTQSMHA